MIGGTMWRGRISRKRISRTTTGMSYGAGTKRAVTDTWRPISPRSTSRASTPKAPPKKTDVFWQIVETNRAPENSQLDDAIDELGEPDHATTGTIKRPAVITLAMIRQTATGGFLDWITDGKNARQIPHRMGECGYVPVQNGAAKDGLWRIDGKRQVIYAKAELSVRERLAAAMALTQKPVGQKDMWRGGSR